MTQEESCFDKMEDFGPTSCFSPFYTQCVQTLRHARSAIPWQNDYLFVSRKLARSLKSCSVLDEGYDERIKRFSERHPGRYTLNQQQSSAARAEIMEPLRS